MSRLTIQTPEYENLISQISNTYTKGVNNAYKAINTELLQTNWEIGQYIVEFEQQGEHRAEYGS